MIHADVSAYAETDRPDPFVHQNKKMLKVALHYGPVMGRIGSMVAYQGDVKFAAQGAGGASKWLKSKMTGEGVPLMQIDGQGEVFLADSASDVHIFYLENDTVSVNGSNILAFSASITYDIQRVSGGVGGAMAGGLYNTILQGTGYVAVLTHGEPVILDVASAPTFADANAVVCWTGGVTMNVKTDVTMRDFIGKGSGEAIQMGFQGQGWVMVQPSENVIQGQGQQAGSKGFLGM
ncbi:MAG: AIM24 family protein [Acidimicrobiales bacterium]|nr:AIM24 family protein [Acidimicrobiales bacterium]MCB1248136.1 AIM24 family protein [Acidimicrobiales bacterium]